MSPHYLYSSGASEDSGNSNYFLGFCMPLETTLSSKPFDRRGNKTNKKREKKKQKSKAEL